jgi:hypothetical protein
MTARKLPGVMRRVFFFRAGFALPDAAFSRGFGLNAPPDVFGLDALRAARGLEENFCFFSVCVSY